MGNHDGGENWFVVVVAVTEVTQIPSVEWEIEFVLKVGEACILDLLHLT